MILSVCCCNAFLRAQGAKLHADMLITAQDPKVEAVALHVGRVNGPGKRLYEGHGYTAVDEDSEWKELLGMNSRTSELQLMVKRIRSPGEVEEAY